jgi:hypothetical protein
MGVLKPWKCLYITAVVRLSYAQISRKEASGNDMPSQKPETPKSKKSTPIQTPIAGLTDPKNHLNAW